MGHKDKNEETVHLPLGDTLPGPILIRAKKIKRSPQDPPHFVVDEPVDDGIGAGTAQDIPSVSPLEIEEED